MMELRILLKRTTELLEEELSSIIALKQQHWGYSDEEQRSWFDENIMAEDLHLLIFLGGGVQIAYLNIVRVNIIINSQESLGLFGIGNVCVDKSNEHLGIGALLMASANAFIKESKTCGLLLCNDRLTEFYKKSGWKVCNVADATVAGSPYRKNIMLLDPFCLLPPDVKEIDMLRNF